LKNFKYYDLILGAYVCVLLCANLIGPGKFTTLHLPILGSVTFLAGVLFFPISYFFGDVLTEVYGYARDRRVVWCATVRFPDVGGHSAPAAGRFLAPQSGRDRDDFR
jgi:uncharacterized PurR-regulated membrane protein YhhQ (DUF165 family)